MIKLLKSLELAFLATFGILLTGARAVQAAPTNVPADQPTIQQAIDAASDGDIILVAPGTYREHINFLGKAITVTSSGGPSVTTIDGGGTDSVMTFDTGEGNNSVLEGFTITNGNASASNLYNGGGIAILYASPTIKGNVISQNAACNGGGVGIYVSPDAVIKDNVITENSPGTCIGADGGGIFIDGGGVVQITGNTISKNTSSSGAGIFLDDAGSPTIKDNVITGNQGGGIATVNQTEGAIIQNLIIANIEGAGIAISIPIGSVGPLSVNNAIVDNQGTEGSGVYVTGFDSQTALYNNLIVGTAGQSAVYCDGSYGETPQNLQGNDAFSPSGVGFDGVCTVLAATNGNISAAPLFLDGTANFHLQYGSPAIGSGDASAPDLPSTDLDGNPRVVNGAIDMGVYEFQLTTVSLTPTSLTFAGQGLGTSSAAQPVTLTNSGSHNLLLAVSLSPNFSETDNCGTALAAGGNCAINVSFSPSTSGVLTGTLSIADNAAGSPQTVSLKGTGNATPDFSIAVGSGGSPSATVSTGGAASYSLAVAPENGFNQTISLACSGAPLLAACTLSPSSLKLDGTNSQSVNVTVATMAASSLLQLTPVRPISNGDSVWVVWVGLMAMLALGVLSQRGADGSGAGPGGEERSAKALLRSAMLFAVLFGVAAVTACGGGGASNSSTPGSSPGTPTGTYELNVTGTSGSLTHSVALTLTIN